MGKQKKKNNILNQNIVLSTSPSSQLTGSGNSSIEKIILTKTPVKQRMNARAKMRTLNLVIHQKKKTITKLKTKIS